MIYSVFFIRIFKRSSGIFLPFLVGMKKKTRFSAKTLAKIWFSIIK